MRLLKSYFNGIKEIIPYGVWKKLSDLYDKKIGRNLVFSRFMSRDALDFHMHEDGAMQGEINKYDIEATTSSTTFPLSKGYKQLRRVLATFTGKQLWF